MNLDGDAWYGRSACAPKRSWHSYLKELDIAYPNPNIVLKKLDTGPGVSAREVARISGVLFARNSFTFQIFLVFLFFLLRAHEIQLY